MDDLTDREAEIGRLIVDGLSNTQIANRLHLPSRTVTVAVGHLYRKAGVQYRAEFVQWANQQNISEAAAKSAREENPSA